METSLHIFVLVAKHLTIYCFNPMLQNDQKINCLSLLIKRFCVAVTTHKNKIFYLAFNILMLCSKYLFIRLQQNQLHPGSDLHTVTRLPYLHIF